MATQFIKGSLVTLLFLSVNACSSSQPPPLHPTHVVPGVPTTGDLPGGMVGSQADNAEDIIAQQEEILKRQQKEMERQNREIEDLRRQEYHNQQLNEYQGK